MSIENPVRGEARGESTSVSIRGIGKRYGLRWVLYGLDAALSHGSVLGIAGPNGSGKSTVIKIIADLVRPDAGSVSVLVGGREVRETERRERVGLVSPEAGLYPALTGAEHVAFFGQLHGPRMSPDGVKAALARVGLAHRRNATVATYSSGMRQRLKFACATIHSPSVLLLDEPYMALDADGVQMVKGVVAEQRARGVCVVAGNSEAELALADYVVRLGGSAEPRPPGEPLPLGESRPPGELRRQRERWPQGMRTAGSD